MTVDYIVVAGDGSILATWSSSSIWWDPCKVKESLVKFLSGVKLTELGVMDVLFEKVRNLPILEGDGCMLDFGFVVPFNVELNDVRNIKGLATYIKLGSHSRISLQNIGISSAPDDIA